MSNRPPYRVHCELPASGNAPRLDIRTICEPDEAEPPEESLYKATEEIVDLFAGAVNSQVWYPSATVDEQARLRVAGKSWVSAPAGWLFQCEMSHVAPQSFLALLGMFTQSHYSYEPLAEVRIGSGDARTVNLEDLLSLRGSVLHSPPVFPFPVDVDRSDVAKGIEIAFEFTDRLSPSRFQEFSEALGIWDHLRLLGAFQLEFREVQEMPPLGKTVWIGPQTAVHSVGEFSEDETAMTALLNLVHWQHLRGLRLNSVTIE